MATLGNQAARKRIFKPSGSKNGLASDLHEIDRLEKEVELGLRIVEARMDRFLREAEQQRFRLECELATERELSESRAAEIERVRDEASKLRSRSASAEARLVQFEQALEGIEDEVEERIREIAKRTGTRLSEAAAELRDAEQRRQELEQDLQKREADLTARILEGERLRKDLEQELQKREADLTARILEGERLRKDLEQALQQRDAAEAAAEEAQNRTLFQAVSMKVGSAFRNRVSAPRSSNETGADGSGNDPDGPPIE